MESLLDVEVEISVELGHRALSIREILELGTGAIVDLQHATDVPVDVLVNGRIIARGEVIAVDDRFGVRLTELVDRPATGN
jgi:flagellar motor switch protein FliN/FliY